MSFSNGFENIIGNGILANDSFPVTFLIETLYKRHIYGEEG